MRYMLYAGFAIIVIAIALAAAGRGLVECSTVYVVGLLMAVINIDADVEDRPSRHP